jgi:hypothetical protein
VVNGSANAIATGATSVRAIRQWHEAGVAVFSHGYLHAKVFVVGRTAHVGSANLSARARSGDTIEAAAVSTEPELVSAVRAFIHGLADDAERVDAAWLQWADGIEVEQPPPPWTTEPAFLPHGPFDLWIGGTEDVDWSDAEEVLVEEGLRTYAARRGRYRTEFIAEYLDDPHTLRDGDLVVLIRRGWARLVRFIERRSSRSAAVGFYRVDTTLPAVRLGELRAALADPAAVNLASHDDWRHVTGPDRSALLARWAVSDQGPRNHAQ